MREQRRVAAMCPLRRLLGVSLFNSSFVRKERKTVMDKSSGKTNIFAKLFFGAIAIWLVPLYQGGKKLLEKSLDGLWGGLLAFFVGLPASIAGGIYAGNWVGWKQF